MDILNAIFWWRRDQREARQEARDAQRLKRESRQELHGLFDREIGALQKLFDVEQDEARKEKIRQEFANRLMAQVVLLDEDIVRHPDFRMVPSSATTLLGKGSGAVSVPARLRSLADEITKKGHPEQTLEVLSLVEELEPEPSPWTAIYKAHAFDRMGKIDDALAELDRAMSQASTHRRALADKCALLMQAGRTADAMAAAEQLLAEEDDVIASYLLGVVADSQGERQRAVEIIDRAVERWPDDPSLLSMRLRLKAKDDAPDIVQAAEEVLRVDPRNDEAYALLAERYLKEGNAGAAVEASAKAVELSSNSVRRHLLLAEAFSKDGRFEEALAEIDLAGRLDPADPWVPVARVYVLDAKAPGGDHRLVSQRLTLSALSAVIEHPAASASLKAWALVVRGFTYSGCLEWDAGSADFSDAGKLEVPKEFEELLVGKLQEVIDSFPKPKAE
jgi:tetratricopeptide (TPR) repeat protein